MIVQHIILEHCLLPDQQLDWSPEPLWPMGLCPRHTTWLTVLADQLFSVSDIAIISLTVLGHVLLGISPPPNRESTMYYLYPDHLHLEAHVVSLRDG